MATQRKISTIVITLFSLFFLIRGIAGPNGLIQNKKTKKKVEALEEKANITHNEGASPELYPEGNRRAPDNKTVPFSLITALLLTIPAIMLSRRKPEEQEADDSPSDSGENHTDGPPDESEGKLINFDSRKGVNRVIDILLAGGIVIMPCDTIYGICAVANEPNKRRLNIMKGRDPDQPLITLCTKDRAKAIFAENCPDSLYNMWPGELTVIANSKDGRKLSLRVPNSKSLEKILFSTGGIYSTSANASGEKEMDDPREMLKAFGDEVDAVAFTKSKMKSVASTIVDVSSYPFMIKREGAIKKEEIAKRLSGYLLKQ